MEKDLESRPPAILKVCESPGSGSEADRLPTMWPMGRPSATDSALSVINVGGSLLPVTCTRRSCSNTAPPESVTRMRMLYWSRFSKSRVAAVRSWLPEREKKALSGLPPVSGEGSLKVNLSPTSSSVAAAYLRLHLFLGFWRLTHCRGYGCCWWIIKVEYVDVERFFEVSSPESMPLTRIE